MEEQALLLKENLLNIRSILTNDKVKIDKLRYKNLVAEKETVRMKKIKMKEKMMETPRNIDRSLRGGNERSAVKSASKSGIGNALGLLTIIVIATNFNKIKELVMNFIKGDTFKAIAETFTNIKNFFTGAYDKFNETRQLFGEKYQEFVAFKDQKVEDFQKLTEKFNEIGEKFKELGEYAIQLKEKFDNLLGIKRDNIVPIEEEKTGLEQYGFNNEDFDLIMGDDGNYRVVPKNNDTSNLGLTDYSNVANSNTNLNENIVPFNNVEPINSQYNFAQYTDDDQKRDIVLITRTNTIIT